MISALNSKPYTSLVMMQLCVIKNNLAYYSPSKLFSNFIKILHFLLLEHSHAQCPHWWWLSLQNIWPHKKMSEFHRQCRTRGAVKMCLRLYWCISEAGNKHIQHTQITSTCSSMLLTFHQVELHIYHITWGNPFAFILQILFVLDWIWRVKIKRIHPKQDRSFF